MSSDLKNKLYNYEVPPPANVWDNITSALNESVEAKFPSKLHNLEVAPPADTWNKINTALDEGLQTSLILPGNRKIYPFFRFAAAVGIIGIIAITAIWIMNLDKSEINVVKENIPSKVNKTSSDNQANDFQNKPTNPSLTADNKELGQNDRKWIAKADTKRRPIYAATMGELNNTPVQLYNAFSINDFEEKYQQLEFSPRNITYDPSKIYDSNPYIMLIRPDGYIIRMSKKIANMIDCLYDLHTGENQDCKDQLKKWREKIAQSPITPSYGNFLDILEMIKSIQENHP